MLGKASLSNCHRRICSNTALSLLWYYLSGVIEQLHYYCCCFGWDWEVAPGKKERRLSRCLHWISQNMVTALQYLIQEDPRNLVETLFQHWKWKMDQSISPPAHALSLLFFFFNWKNRLLLFISPLSLLLSFLHLQVISKMYRLFFSYAM